MTGHAFSIDAPAKINLGLEILAKRADGYHEIRSILARTTLVDTLTFVRGPGAGMTGFTGRSDPIDPERNLVSAAIEAYNQAASTSVTPNIDVVKRIPAAAGLGGASSDAAATLRGMQRLTSNAIDGAGLLRVASNLGSDVPFFLGSPVALVKGTGTTVEPLPRVTGSLIVVMPDIAIERKTAQLYSALVPGDFTDGSTVDAIAGAVIEGRTVPTELPNAFDAAFRRIDPRMGTLVDRLHRAGIGESYLSGAGPARYLLFASAAERDAAVPVLIPCLLPGDEVFCCELATEGR